MTEHDSSDRADSEGGLAARLREDPSNVTSLLGDFYRGEVDRTTTWRSRLDQTTNWAVVVVGAILTWAFTSPDHPHYVLLIGVFAVLAFLIVEAHRFREYDIWRSRVRTVQTNLLGGIIDEGATEADGWRTSLREDIEDPEYTMSLRAAVGHRLRRMYLALLLVLLLAWLARVSVFVPDESWRRTAAIPGIGGEAVVLVVAGVYAAVIAVTVWSTRTETLRE
ncbi:MAG: DUF2270 domain-containing protein [Halosimplex sp.]